MTTRRLLQVLKAGDSMAHLKLDANRLLGGGTEGFRVRLSALRGHPIVVNQWASWCRPCGDEFPILQRVSERYAGDAAFLGVDSSDSTDAAERFTRRFPVGYPHFLDRDAEVTRVFRGGRVWPTTAFYDASGTLVYTRVGAYRRQEALESDIKRYALRD